LLANYILGKSSKLQFNIPEFEIKIEDAVEICNKIFSLTSEDLKRLNINKSILWYMHKHISKGTLLRWSDGGENRVIIEVLKE